MTEMNLSGETAIPKGKVASVVTYLEMTAPPGDRPLPERRDLGLERIHLPELNWYRALHRAIGENWLWFSRLCLSDGTLKDILENKHTEVYALRSEGEDVGLFELDLAKFPEIELAYFGVIPDQYGSGAGRWMMTHGLRLAWAKSPKRVRLHTCNTDHPAALPFYRRTGFIPYKFAIDVYDDPRLTGVLDPSAAPQVPLLR